MHRYGDINYVMNMNFNDGADLINKAYKKSVDEVLMQRWIMHYQHAMSFDEFKDEVIEISYKKKDSRTQEEILDMVFGIIGSLGVSDHGNI